MTGKTLSEVGYKLKEIAEKSTHNQFRTNMRKYLKELTSEAEKRAQYPPFHPEAIKGRLLSTIANQLKV